MQPRFLLILKSRPPRTKIVLFYKLYLEDSLKTQKIETQPCPGSSPRVSSSHTYFSPFPVYFSVLVADRDSFRVELKETTLGSSSPAVTTKQSSGTITSPSGSGSTADKSSSSSLTSTSNTNPTSDSTLKPGRLTVQIYEAKGLTLPPGINRPTERPPSSSSASGRGHDRAKPSRSHLALPYIVLEFDKNEVLLETNYGELSAPVWGRVQDLYCPP